MTALSFPFSRPPDQGELIEIAPSIRWLRMPLPYVLDHINLYLVRNGDGWTIVDSGFDSQETRDLWSGIFERLDGPVKAVVCTHFHPDHTGLAGWLTETLRVPLYMSRTEYYSLLTMAVTSVTAPWQYEQFYRHTGMPPAVLERTMVNINNWNKGEGHPPPHAYHRLQDGHNAPVADGIWHVITGEGHSPEHACLHNPDLAVLFSGDQLLARISPNVSVGPTEPEASLLRPWFHSLERIGLLPAETLVLPAHHLPFYGVPRRARELRDHHIKVLDKLQTFCRETPSTAYTLMQRLFPGRDDQMDDLLALGETLAHLIHLRDEGRIQRELDSEGIYWFSCVADTVEASPAMLHHH